MRSKRFHRGGPAVALLLLALAAPAVRGQDAPGNMGASAPGSEAFSTPIDGMSLGDLFDFTIGTGTFSLAWLEDPAETGFNPTEGIGPLYNGYSCVSCHRGAGRSHPVERIDMVAASRGFLPPTPTGIALLSAVRTPDGRQIPHPDFGLQVQDVAIDGYDPEARIELGWTYQPVTLNDGTVVELRAPDHRLTDRVTPPRPGEIFSQRTAPPLAGLGLLEAIDAADILALEDPEDRDGDGISGIARRLPHGRIGRFGWKGGAATIRGRIAAALWTDMGISSEERPDAHGDCVEGVTCHRHDAAGPVIEADPFILRAVTDYVTGLAPPARHDTGDPAVRRGADVFDALACQACHVPSWRTSPDAARRYLSDQEIHPYTDLLLHDMGLDLADGYREDNASGAEWRTAPLWGIGRTHEVEGFASFLHDGRARTLTEAILWHGGEADASRKGFMALDKEDREALIAFLESL